MVAIFTCLQVLYGFSGRLVEIFNNIKVDLYSRQDFLVIPFQAVEVYLDNVVPTDSK
jgi:hypothetical protein